MPPRHRRRGRAGPGASRARQRQLRRMRAASSSYDRPAATVAAGWTLPWREARRPWPRRQWRPKFRGFFLPFAALVFFCFFFFAPDGHERMQVLARVVAPSCREDHRGGSGGRRSGFRAATAGLHLRKRLPQHGRENGRFLKCARHRRRDFAHRRAGKRQQIMDCVRLRVVLELNPRWPRLLLLLLLRRCSLP